MVMRGWFKHSPVKEDCSSCHEHKKGNHPNDAGREFDLVSKLPDLCTTCHDINKGDKSKHAPAKEGECLSCHDPHSSDSRNLLKTEKGKSLCLNCHDVAGKDMIVHGPVLKNECSTCHEPHNSKFAKLLRNDEDKLCLSCHNKTIKGTNSTIEDINLKITSKTVHAPVAQGCSGCHLPHASKNKALLITEFNIESYVYEKGKTGTLCFTCHSNDILSKDKPQSTGFRNDNQNLHFVHVNRDKSRNCNLCHDVHGTENPYLINNTTRYGKWELPINFKQTATGGTCSSGCHQTLSYNNKPGSTAKTGDIVSDKKSKNEIKIGSIRGQIKIDSTIDISLIQGLGVNLTNSDSSIYETLALDKGLNYKRDNLPYGKYLIALNTDDLDELKAKPDNKSISVDLQDTVSNFAVNNANFSLKFDSIPTKKLENVIQTEIIKPNSLRTFLYKNEKTILETKGMNNFLNSAIDYLNKNPKSRISIIAHTDNTGTTQELQKRSNNMTKVIEIYLMKRGINRKRILAQGKGSLVPVQNNATEKGRAANRRIEINILK